TACLRKTKACNRDVLSCRLRWYGCTRYVAQAVSLRTDSRKRLACATSSFKLQLFDARQQRLVADGQARGGARFVEVAFAQCLIDLAALDQPLRPRAHFGEAAAQVEAIEQG